jgi:hypothetical protein
VIDGLGVGDLEAQLGILPARQIDHRGAEVDPHSARRLEGLEEVSGPSAEFEDRPPRLNHRSEGTFKVVVVAAVAPVPAVAVGGEPIVVSPNSGFELPVVLVDARQGRLPPIVEGVHT